jgi:hypothetical protein
LNVVGNFQMTLTQPIEIDLLAFIRTGKFDSIKLGQTKEWIINNFPDPDDTNNDNFNSPIWHYGNIEFHFDNDNKLFLIFSDYIDTLTGGQSLHLQKWIFDQPKNLTTQNVTHHFAKERIGYKLEYLDLTNGYTSATIESLISGVKLSFALPEIDEEDFEKYLERLKTVDSNSFLLSSFSLMTK